MVLYASRKLLHCVFLFGTASVLPNGWAADKAPDQLLGPPTLPASFGPTLDVAGTRAIVGSTGSGRAYIFDLKSAGWTLDAEIVGPQVPYWQQFGSGGVAIEGDIAVIANPRTNQFGPTSGSVYVYEKVAGIWANTATLTATNGGAWRRFGADVAISGGRIVVGAPHTTTTAGVSVSTGYAYVFDKGPVGWVGTLLSGSFAKIDWYFGESVAVVGNLVVVGSPGLVQPFGEVYIFEGFVLPDGSTQWSEVALIQASDKSSGDRFGKDVGIDGNTVLIGAPGRDMPAAPDMGAVYMVQESPGQLWAEVGMLLPPSGAGSSANFGSSLSVEVGRLVVGAEREKIVGQVNAGAVYLLKWEGVWTHVSRLLPTAPVNGQYFGRAVSVGGGVAVVGSKAAHEAFSYDCRVLTYGSGCSDGMYSPVLSVGGYAQSGSSVSTAVTGGPPGLVAGFAVSSSSGSYPLGQGCDLLVASSFLFVGPVVLDGAGSFLANAMVPQVPAVSVYMQAVVASAASPMGYVTTNAYSMDFN